MGHIAGGGATGVIVPLSDSGHFLALNYCCSFAYGLALVFKKINQFVHVGTAIPVLH